MRKDLLGISNFGSGSQSSETAQSSMQCYVSGVTCTMDHVGISEIQLQRSKIAGPLSKNSPVTSLIESRTHRTKMTKKHRGCVPIGEFDIDAMQLNAVLHQSGVAAGNSEL